MLETHGINEQSPSNFIYCSEVIIKPIKVFWSAEVVFVSSHLLKNK